MNEKVGIVYQQLLKTANRKQQNTDNVHLLVENCDIMLEISNKLIPYEPIRDCDKSDVRVILFLRFST